VSDPRHPNQPNREPPPLRPPEPQPYQAPDWSPSNPRPFAPPGGPDPSNPGRNPWSSLWTFSIAAAAIVLPSMAFAAGVGGGGTMPWDTPLTNIETDLSGTTATAIALIAMVGVIGVLIFGGEINHFVRTLCFIVMGAATLVAGNNFFTTIGIAGATVEGREIQSMLGLFACLGGALAIGIGGKRLHLRARRRRLAKTLAQ
jgi:type IV secretion system protein TrbC